MEHDPPLLYYTAFLMDTFGEVPYRDFFETSMPGSFVFYYAVSKMFGFGDSSFIHANLFFLCILFSVTYLFMRRFGNMIAVWALVLFGLIYLTRGQTILLQRDYVGIFPVAFALLSLPRKWGAPVSLVRFGTIGCLFGIAALFKPHLVISLPILFFSLLAFRWVAVPRSATDFLKCGTVTGLSMLIPIAAALIWLAANSALTPFINMVCEYLPLHCQLNGYQEALPASARLEYLTVNGMQLGGYGVVVIGALFSCYYVAEHTQGNKATAVSLLCLCLFVIAYAIYPIPAGKFWPYHYMPLAYFASLSIPLCLYGWPRVSESYLLSVLREVFMLFIVFMMISVQLVLPEYINNLRLDLNSGGEAHIAKGGRVDEIANWLKPQLRPGDTVQPLDWTGGSIHAMLIAEARLATRFMYDYHFYHSISSPIIHKLRDEFMNQLREERPRFIIEVYTDKPWVRGVDITREFLELYRFLERNYTAKVEGNGYRIYELTGNGE
jgi:4-amino-4-deoxy-L-arabinose transferase-like glycosyltransferase